LKRGWELANHPDPKLRDPRRAVELANEAVEHAPQSAPAWQYLGWVKYRAGNWQASIEALEKSCALQMGGDGGQWIVMSLCHAKLASETEMPLVPRTRHQEEARRFYDQAVKSIDGWTLGTDAWADTIRGFRAEATALLEVKQVLE
jgi:predicted TPR repeat methyltransferase